MSFADDDSVDWGLELNMLLNDDCISAPVFANAMHDAREAQSAPREAEAGALAPAPAPEEEVKKAELAVVHV